MTQKGDDDIDWDLHWTDVQLDVLESEQRVLDAHVFSWVVDSLPTTPFKVLEIGCGPAIYALAWESVGGSYNGLDFSEIAIGKAKARRPECQFIIGHNSHVKEFGLTFDVVYTSAHLQHVANANKFYLFKQLYDVLTPSGLLVTMNEKHDVDSKTTFLRDNYIKFVESCGFKLERYINREPRGDPTNGFAFRKV